MKWEKVGAPTGAYWDSVWAPENNEIDLYVLQLPDKTFWVADVMWSNFPTHDVGPYATLEDAIAAAEMLDAQGITLTGD